MDTEFPEQVVLPDPLIRLLKQTTLGLLLYENEYIDSLGKLKEFIHLEIQKKINMIEAINEFLEE